MKNNSKIEFPCLNHLYAIGELNNIEQKVVEACVSTGNPDFVTPVLMNLNAASGKIVRVDDYPPIELNSYCSSMRSEHKIKTICKACKYSSGYVNMNYELELKVFSYILSHLEQAEQLLENIYIKKFKSVVPVSFTNEVPNNSYVELFRYILRALRDTPSNWKIEAVRLICESLKVGMPLFNLAITELDSIVESLITPVSDSEYEESLMLLTGIVVPSDNVDYSDFDTSGIDAIMALGSKSEQKKKEPLVDTTQMENVEPTDDSSCILCGSTSSEVVNDNSKKHNEPVFPKDSDNESTPIESELLVESKDIERVIHEVGRFLASSREFFVHVQDGSIHFYTRQMKKFTISIELKQFKDFKHEFDVYLHSRAYTKVCVDTLTVLDMLSEAGIEMRNYIALDALYFSKKGIKPSAELVVYHFTEHTIDKTNILSLAKDSLHIYKELGLKASVSQMSERRLEQKYYIFINRKEIEPTDFFKLDYSKLDNKELFPFHLVRSLLSENFDSVFNIKYVSDKDDILTLSYKSDINKKDLYDVIDNLCYRVRERHEQQENYLAISL